MTDVQERTTEEQAVLLEELDDVAAMLGLVDGLRDRLGEVLRSLLGKNGMSPEQLAERVTAAGMQCSTANVRYLAYQRGKTRKRADR